jgi:hypothetical protein
LQVALGAYRRALCGVGLCVCAFSIRNARWTAAASCSALIGFGPFAAVSGAVLPWRWQVGWPLHLVLPQAVLKSYSALFERTDGQHIGNRNGPKLKFRLRVRAPPRRANAQGCCASVAVAGASIAIELRRRRQECCDRTVSCGTHVCFDSKLNGARLNFLLTVKRAQLALQV